MDLISKNLTPQVTDFNGSIPADTSGSDLLYILAILNVEGPQTVPSSDTPDPSALIG